MRSNPVSRISSASSDARRLLLAAGALIVTLSVRTHAARAAWPPAPGADTSDPSTWPNDPDYARAWPDWSFLPRQDAGTAPYLSADQRFAAAGMSVDRAWTYSVGRPQVVIAVLDSGVAWDDPELVDKVALNPGELVGARKPQSRTGAPCGGTGPLAGYDCDGDGVLTAADYRDDPRVAPVVGGDPCFKDAARTVVGGDRIAGDVNRNCLLDAGDLVALFSDATDDDGDGYIDDIAGWDFYKNDADAYDDTRFGHGTTQAKDAVAKANDGVGGAGACPACRFVPVRVASGGLADANDLAKAIIFAADSGARVVAVPLATVDMNGFARAAIDYAYGKDVLVVTSMADENSRHHAPLSVVNHTLPVHAVRYDGASSTTSTTFLASAACNDFGGQLALSVSGGTCSSDAAGRAAGIAGLLYSYALSQPAPLALGAEETAQLFKTSADDVDLPESRLPENAARLYESKTGFDQRSGYGRANAARAMEAIRSGLLPPEVDIVSPQWFALYHADRVQGAVPVMGRVAAKRAQSYDYEVAWAAGVEPSDDEFRLLAGGLTNVPGATVTGGGAGGPVPLATFDPREIDTAHAPDPESTRHENDRTVTLRVRAVAHYPAGDVRGEARRTVAVVNAKNGLDADLVPGFPVKLEGSLEAGAKLVDIDGDRVREIVQPASDGSLHVFTFGGGGGAPRELTGFPYRAAPIDGLDPNVLVKDPLVPSYLNAPAYAQGASGGVDPDRRDAFLSAAAVGDLDGDGSPEIVASTWGGAIHVVDAKGRAYPGWPKRLPLVPSCPLDPTKARPDLCMDATHDHARGALASPVLVDLDRDGRPEIVQAAFDGRLYAFHGDASPVRGWPVLLHAERARRYARTLSTPLVHDFNGDGTPDLVVGSNETLGDDDEAGAVFMIDGRGTATPTGPYLPDWPLAVGSARIASVVGEGASASPAGADIDGDGKVDVILQGNGSPPVAYPADPGRQTGLADAPNALLVRVDESGTLARGFAPASAFGPLSKARGGDTMAPLFSSPSVGDLDQDGVPDVVMSGGSLALVGDLRGATPGGASAASEHLLAMWSGKTARMMPGSPVVLEDYALFMNHAVADLTGDDYPEVVTATGVYFVRAVDACGREAPGFPKFTNGWHTGAPAVGDVDGDHGLEVVAGTREGYLFAWHTGGRDDGVIAWESAHHDAANTGDYARRLEQGVPEKAETPLVCGDARAAAASFDAGGGCQSVPARGAGGDNVLRWGGAGLLLAALARRRRTFRSNPFTARAQPSIFRRLQ